MKCDYPRCSAEVRAVISSIRHRNEVKRERLCEEHADLVLRERLRQDQAALQLPSDSDLEVDIDSIVSDGRSQLGSIYLREVDGLRQLSLGCGIIEASLVCAAITEKQPLRPLTHDAMLLITHALGARIESVRISELLADGVTFKAEVRIRVLEASVEVDMRPTDALSLAVRSGAPMYVAGSLLQ